VSARAEGHTGIQPQQVPTGVRGRLQPGRTNEQLVPDPLGLPVLLPTAAPIFRLYAFPAQLRNPLTGNEGILLQAQGEGCQIQEADVRPRQIGVNANLIFAIGLAGHAPTAKTLQPPKDQVFLGRGSDETEIPPSTSGIRRLCGRKRSGIGNSSAHRDPFTNLGKNQSDGQQDSASCHPAGYTQCGTLYQKLQRSAQFIV
jgi:hypothetical protein